MNLEFNIGGDIAFSADMGYRPAPTPTPSSDNKPVDARIIGDLAGEFLLGDAEQTPLPPYPKLFNWWQETNDNTKTSATLTPTVPADCLLVVAVMCRGNTVSISGEGWNKFLETNVAASNQRIIIWTKHVSAGSYNVTVTQDTSVRMSMKIFAIYKCSSLTIVDNVLTTEGSNNYNPTATTGKRRLYLADSVYANGYNVAITASNYSGLDLVSITETRFSAFYDYQPPLGITPTLNLYNASDCHILTLDIEEE